MSKCVICVGDRVQFSVADIYWMVRFALRVNPATVPSLRLLFPDLYGVCGLSGVGSPLTSYLTRS